VDYAFFCALISVVCAQRLVCLLFILIAAASDSCRCPGCEVVCCVACMRCVKFITQSECVRYHRMVWYGIVEFIIIIIIIIKERFNVAFSK